MTNLLRGRVIGMCNTTLISLTSLSGGTLFYITYLVVLVNRNSVTRLRTYKIELSVISRSCFMHSCPVFNLSPTRQDFAYLNARSGKHLHLHGLITRIHPRLIPETTQVLLGTNQYSTTVNLTSTFLSHSTILRLTKRCKISLTLAKRKTSVYQTTLNAVSTSSPTPRPAPTRTLNMCLTTIDISGAGLTHCVTSIVRHKNRQTTYRVSPIS